MARCSRTSPIRKEVPSPRDSRVSQRHDLGVRCGVETFDYAARSFADDFSVYDDDRAEWRLALVFECVAGQLDCSDEVRLVSFGKWMVGHER